VGLTVVLAVCGIIGAVLVKVLADDVKAWLPWIKDRIVDRAVANLPACERDRYAEEWRSYVEQWPGEISRVIAAIGLIGAAKSIRAQMPVWKLVLTRASDVALALTALVVLAPLGVAIALAIKIEDGGPVIYAQRRYRPCRREIRVFVFRTKAGLAGKVTRVGRFLRKTNIDVLPQLVNVLLGDMTLVRWRNGHLAS
jgi:hypothetical protein